MNSMELSRFAQVPHSEPSPIFEVLKKYAAIANPNKMNLSIGMLMGKSGLLLEYEVVNQAEQIILDMNKEYPTCGCSSKFNSALSSLIFPQNSNVIQEGRYLIVQTPTGGASLRLASEVIEKFLSKSVHLSKQTFGPYSNLFSNLSISYYPYFNKKRNDIDVDSMVEYLNNIPDGSVINLQLSSHNPTSIDPTIDDWNKIAYAMKGKKHFAFFDIAYLGYGSGSIEEDLYPIRKFAEEKIEIVISYSSGKNFTNYSDDAGALIVVLNKPDPLVKLRSHLIALSRGLFSYSGIYGSRIIETILTTPELKEKWIEEQKQTSLRIKDLRVSLIEEFERQNSDSEMIKLLKKQRGIYMFLNMSQKQVLHLMEMYSIFLCSGGRINLTSVSEDKMEYLVSSINSTLKEII